MKKIKIILFIAGIILLVLFLLNPIITNRIRASIKNQITEINSSNNYLFEVHEIDFNLFSRSISLQGLTIKPSDSLIKKFKDRTLNESVLKELKVSEVDISGVDISNLLFNKKLHVNNVAIVASHLNIYRPQKEFKIKNIDKKKDATFTLDSIRIKGLNGLKLDNIHIDNYGIYIIEMKTKDTIADYLGKEFVIEGVQLEPLNHSDDMLMVNNNSLNVNLKQQSYDLPGDIYTLSFNDLSYSHSQNSIIISHLELNPIDGFETAASNYKHTTDIFDMSVKNISVRDFDLDAALFHGAIQADTVDLDSVNLEIYKDKRKPWNYNVRALLPNEKLAQQNQPLHINSVSINNSNFKYTEHLPENNNKLHVTFTELNATVSNISSLTDSIANNKKLEINLSSTFLESFPLQVKIEMPYNNYNNFFFSAESSGSMPATRLNPILYAALGLQFEGGSINGVRLHCNASPYMSKGEMTLLYNDLDIKMLKKDNSENKKLSFLANLAVRSNNPSDDGKVKFAEIHFDRVMYKGLGNFLWKSAESGIVNSVVPFGKRSQRE